MLKDNLKNRKQFRLKCELPVVLHKKEVTKHLNNCDMEFSTINNRLNIQNNIENNGKFEIKKNEVIVGTFYNNFVNNNTIFNKNILYNSYNYNLNITKNNK